MADEPQPSSTKPSSMSRVKLYHASRVPVCVDIIFPGFAVSGRIYPPHTMRVCSSAHRGAKLYIELTSENLDLDGYACPPPPMQRLSSLVPAG